MVTIEIRKGDDLLSVEELVMNKLIEMDAVAFADRSECRDKSDSVKYDIKITLTKMRKGERNSY